MHSGICFLVLGTISFDLGTIVFGGVDMSLSDEIRNRYREWLGCSRVPATMRRRLELIERRYRVGLDPQHVGFLSYLLLDDERYRKLCVAKFDQTRFLLRSAWDEYLAGVDRTRQHRSYRLEGRVVFLERAAELTGYRYGRVDHAVRALNRYYCLDASSSSWRRLLLGDWSRVVRMRQSGRLVSFLREVLSR